MPIGLEKLQGPSRWDAEDFRELALQRFYNPEMRPNMPHTKMPLFPEQRDEYLSELLVDDTALDLYDFSTVKKYSEQPDLWTKAMQADTTAGYHVPDTGLSYVKDIEKLGTYPGKRGESQGDIKLAQVAGHELTHDLLLKYGIDIDLPETRQGSGWGVDRYGKPVYIGKTHEKNEILNVLLDIQKGSIRESMMQLQGSPYSISRHPSGEYGYKGLMKDLDPYADEFYRRVEAEKKSKANPLIYDEETGYDPEELYKRGIGRQMMRDRRATQQGIAQVAMQKQIQQAEAAAKQQATTYQGPTTTSGRDYQPQRPTRPGGFTDPGKGSYGPWKASGGIIDKALSGRSRYI